MQPDTLQGHSRQAVVGAFQAFEDHAAYVDSGLTRSQAITLARDVAWQLTDNYVRAELRAVRVFMRQVEGEEADEAFCGEFEFGYLECDKDATGAFPMWKVEPRA